VECTQKLAAGFRAYSPKFAAAEAVAKRFKGLEREVTPGKVLGAFKAAAEGLGVPGSLERLIDYLFKSTRPQDWREGATPIVWPSNEKIARKLRLTVRQVQNLVRLGIDMGLLFAEDSPNGHRGGRRDADGNIVWAYGLVLSPLAVRYGELKQLAEASEAEFQAIEALKRRRTIARKSIAQIAQTALELGLAGADWEAEVEITRMALRHARGIEGIKAHTALVEQLEARRERLATIFRAAVDDGDGATNTVENPSDTVDSSCTDEAGFVHGTTTRHSSNSKRNTVTAQREEGSGLARPDVPERETSVDRDLERYGVSPEFIVDVCREVCWQLTYGPARWDDVVALGRREAENLHVPAVAWNEAVRIMGRRGAAAAMITIAHKADCGLVESPGAYLRGLTTRAMTGELQLGRTFHGIKAARAAAA
jgi:replication initiation protein RepC